MNNMNSMEKNTIANPGKRHAEVFLKTWTHEMILRLSPLFARQLRRLSALNPDGEKGIFRMIRTMYLGVKKCPGCGFPSGRHMKFCQMCGHLLPGAKTPDGASVGTYGEVFGEVSEKTAREAAWMKKRKEIWERERHEALGPGPYFSRMTARDSGASYLNREIPENEVVFLFSGWDSDIVQDIAEDCGMSDLSQVMEFMLFRGMFGMECPHCGCVIPHDAWFCPVCGKEILEEMREGLKGWMNNEMKTEAADDTEEE